jgi:hypothetical protein
VTAIATTGGLSEAAVVRPVSPLRSVSAVIAARAGNVSAGSVTEAVSARQLAQRQSGTTHRRHHRLSPKRIAWLMMHRFGWRAKYEFRYVKWIWNRESSWNKYATNPYSGAYGIPQALPAYKMASAGRNWRTSATTQIRWGLRYIRARYGSPRRAWEHEIDFGWY